MADQSRIVPVGAEEYDSPARLGVPPQTAPATAQGSPRFATPSGVYAVPTRQDVPQQGALGCPSISMREFRELPEAQSKLAGRVREDAAMRQLEADALWDEPLAPMGLFDQPVVKWIAALAGVGFAIFVLGHILSLVNEIRQLPVPVNYIGWGGLGVVVLALVIVLVRLAWIYLQYSTAQKLPKLTAVLNERLALRREQSLEHLQTLRVKLTTFVEGCKVDDAKIQRQFKRIGATDLTLKTLSDSRVELLRGPRSGDRAWVEQFEAQFLAQLDQLAKDRVAASGWRVFRLTGISQRSGLDALVILVESLALMGDLCRIYGVRANRADSMRLLLYVITNAALAAQAEHVLGSAADAGADSVAHGAGHVAEIGAKLVGRVAGSVADAGINKWLIHRLGGRAILALRPFR